MFLSLLKSYKFVLNTKFYILFLLELQALAELLGAYGMKHLGQKMMQQIASQVGEIKVNGIILLRKRKTLLSRLCSKYMVSSVSRSVKNV